MKITISENIKRLRKEKNITQAELASEFGITCQSVCRWENGAAYPDVELIPEIAAFFGISTDKLLGCDNESVESKIRKVFLLDLNDNETSVKDKIVQMRAVMADLPYEPQIKYHIIRQYHILGREECTKNISELREFAEYICASDADFWIKHNTRITMIDIEPEEDACKIWLEQLGNDYATPDEALLNRYKYRGDIDKYNQKAQENLVSAISRIAAIGFKKEGDIEYKKLSALKILDILDTMRDTSNDIDAWVHARARMKIRLANACFMLGETDKGYNALEDAVDLLVKITALSADTPVGYNTPLLDLVHRDKKFLLNSAKAMVEQIFIEGSEYWAGLKSVSNEERYKAAVKVMTNLL